MNSKSSVDWVAIEAAFTAGKYSNRRLAKLFGVSESAIRKRAKSAGWVRTEKTKVRTVDPAPAAPQKTATINDTTPAAGGDSETERDPIELGKDLALRMLDELDYSTSNVDEIERAIFDDTAEDIYANRRNAMLKAVSLPQRAQTLKTVAQSLAILRETEAAKGKKAMLKDAASDVASGGRFAPAAPPKLVAVGSK